MSRAKVVHINVFACSKFFTADLDDGGVRIGTDSKCFDIPAGHAWHQRVTEASTLREVTDLFNELSEAMA